MKKWLVISIVGLLALGGSFYGGTRWGYQQGYDDGAEYGKVLARPQPPQLTETQAISLANTQAMSTPIGSGVPLGTLIRGWVASWNGSAWVISGQTERYGSVSFIVDDRTGKVTGP
jgi:hypothetical protein